MIKIIINDTKIRISLKWAIIILSVSIIETFFVNGVQLIINLRVRVSLSLV